MSCIAAASRGGWSSADSDACVLECHAVKIKGMEDGALVAGLDRFTNTQRPSLILIKGLSVIYEHRLAEREYCLNVLRAACLPRRGTTRAWRRRCPNQ